MRLLMTFAFLLLVIGTQASESEPDQSEITQAVANLGEMVRVTETPHPMLDSTITDCRPPVDSNSPDNIHEGYLTSAFCNVYVNKKAKPMMVSGRGEYPVGALIVKTKLKTKESKDVELYTVMRKMRPGYDSNHGDWEYSVLDGKSRRVLALGRIDSCIGCHEDHKKQDYVTRTYMKRRK